MVERILAKEEEARSSGAASEGGHPRKLPERQW